MTNLQTREIVLIFCEPTECRFLFHYLLEPTLKPLLRICQGRTRIAEERMASCVYTCADYTRLYIVCLRHVASICSPK